MMEGIQTLRKYVVLIHKDTAVANQEVAVAWVVKCDLRSPTMHFLRPDVNPHCFLASMKYLNELVVSLRG